MGFRWRGCRHCRCFWVWGWHCVAFAIDLNRTQLFLHSYISIFTSTLTLVTVALATFFLFLFLFLFFCSQKIDGNAPRPQRRNRPIAQSRTPAAPVPARDVHLKISLHCPPCHANAHAQREPVVSAIRGAADVELGADLPHSSQSSTN